MRNLKRALSLALASVMVLGMMVVGSSASYKDVEAFEDNIEAIEVLQAVGIMTGDENGNFNPDANVTRNEMAVIMSNLLNLDYDYYRGINKFTDVPEWAAPYVAACVAEGVTAGIGNNQYGGDQNVTAAQASLMIMKALGYFQYAADFGEDWQVATVRQASYISLFDGVNAKAEDALTRNQVAQLVLNGLEADLVEFTGDVGATYGDLVFGYRAEYSTRTSTDKKYNTLKAGKTDISDQGQYYIQLGEELYNGKLTKRDDTDAFERPATTWRYNSKTIGTYADAPDATYTAGVKFGTIYSDLGLTKGISSDDITIYEDGALVNATHAHSGWLAYDIVKGETAKIGGNGALTQVYYDDDDDTVIIVVINTYVAKVTAVRAETSTRDAYVTLDTTAPFTAPVTGITTYDTDEFSKDDIVAYTYSRKSGENEIQSMALADKVSGIMSTYTTGGSVTVDGVKYDANTTSASAIANFTGTVDKKSDVAVYLDAYGYGLYVDADTSVDYAVVLDYNEYTGDWNDTAKAKLLFTDGTTETVEVELYDDGTNALTAVNPFGTTDSTGGNLSKYDIVSYTVDSDKVYTLTLVADSVAGETGTTFSVQNGATAFHITSNDAANLGTGSDTCQYADGETIFLVADTSGSKTTYSVYEGIANVPTIKHTGTTAPSVSVFAKNGETVAKVVFIEKNSDMSMTTDNKDIIYIKGSSSTGVSYSEKLGNYYQYDAYINGEAQPIQVTTAVTEHTLVYGPAYNSKGVLVLANCESYVNSTQTTDDSLYYVIGTGSVKNTVITLGNTPLTYAADVNVYSITVDGKLVEIDITSLAQDTDDEVFYKLNDKGKLTDVYVKVVDAVESVTSNTSGIYSAALAKNASTSSTLELTVTSTDSSANTAYTVEIYAYPVGEKEKADVVLTLSGTLSAGSDTQAVVSNTNNSLVFYAVVTMSTGETMTTTAVIGG